MKNQVRAVGIVQDDDGTLLVGMASSDQPGYTGLDVGVSWEHLEEHLRRVLVDGAVLIETLPNMDRARAFVERDLRRRWLVRYADCAGDYVVLGREVVVGRPGGPLEVPDRAARRLAGVALRVTQMVSSGAPLPGVAAVLTLRAESEGPSLQMAIAGETEQVACRIDQPLVFEGAFLRTYDLETGQVEYRPSSRIKHIRVSNSATKERA